MLKLELANKQIPAFSGNRRFDGVNDNLVVTFFHRHPSLDAGSVAVITKLNFEVFYYYCPFLLIPFLFFIGNRDVLRSCIAQRAERLKIVQ